MTPGPGPRAVLAASALKDRQVSNSLQQAHSAPRENRKRMLSDEMDSEKEAGETSYREPTQMSVDAAIESRTESTTNQALSAFGPVQANAESTIVVQLPAIDNVPHVAEIAGGLHDTVATLADDDLLSSPPSILDFDNGQPDASESTSSIVIKDREESNLKNLDSIDININGVVQLHMEMNVSRDGPSDAVNVTEGSVMQIAQDDTVTTTVVGLPQLEDVLVVQDCVGGDIMNTDVPQINEDVIPTLVDSIDTTRPEVGSVSIEIDLPHHSKVLTPTRSETEEGPFDDHIVTVPKSRQYTSLTEYPADSGNVRPSLYTFKFGTSLSEVKLVILGMINNVLAVHSALMQDGAGKN